MTDRIMTFVSGMCAPVLLWVMVSWADVISNNMDGAVHAWNFFQVVFG